MHLYTDMAHIWCMSLNSRRDWERFFNMRLWHSFTANRKVSSEDEVGFFRRLLALYIPKFSKISAASLTDLPEPHLGLP